MSSWLPLHIRPTSAAEYICNERPLFWKTLTTARAKFTTDYTKGLQSAIAQEQSNRVEGDRLLSTLRQLPKEAIPRGWKLTRKRVTITITQRFPPLFVGAPTSPPFCRDSRQRRTHSYRPPFTMHATGSSPHSRLARADNTARTGPRRSGKEWQGGTQRLKHSSPRSRGSSAGRHRQGMD